MSYEIKSLVNEKYKNYPSKIFVSHMKVKHWRSLIIASKNGMNAIEAVWSSILDEIIDFERTEFIKNSDNLTSQDREKIFYWQRINSKGSEYTIYFKCPKCEESNENSFDLIKDMEEEPIKNNIEEKILKIIVDDSEIDINLVLPTKKSVTKLYDIIKKYKIEIFDILQKKLFIKEREQLEKELKELENEKNKTILQELKKKTDIRKSSKIMNEEGKIEEIDEKIKNNIDNINNKIQNKSEEIKHTLKIFYEQIEDNMENIKKFLIDSCFEELSQNFEDVYKDIKSYEDLDFDFYTNYIISLFISVEGIPNDAKKFMNIISEMDDSYVKEIENFFKEIKHGFRNELTFTCKNCEHSFKENFDLGIDFFLT